MSITPVGGGGINPQESQPPYTPQEVAKLVSELLRNLLWSLDGLSSMQERYEAFKKNWPNIKSDMELVKRVLGPNSALFKSMQNLSASIKYLFEIYIPNNPASRDNNAESERDALNALNSAFHVAQESSK